MHGNMTVRFPVIKDMGLMDDLIELFTMGGYTPLLLRGKIIVISLPLTVDSFSSQPNLMDLYNFF